MSKNWYVLEYDCECLIDQWGNTCGETSKFMLLENCSSDTNTIFHKHGNERFTLYQPSEYISDQELGALKRLLNKDGVKEGYEE